MFWILIGGLIPLAAAYSLGKLCFRNAPDVLALGAGAVLESGLIFCLAAAGIAFPVTFAVLAAILLTPLFRLRPRLRVPLPRHPLVIVILVAYGLFYLIHALAPEIQPDGMTYHLGLVAEYGRLGGFARHIDFYAMLPQGGEMLYLFAYDIGRHSAAKLVSFGFLLATIPLVLELGRRIGVSDRISGAAAALYFCGPIVGIVGTSSYLDSTVVFCTLSSLLALLLWKQGEDKRYLWIAGLTAGFCYALKMSGALVPLYAVAFPLFFRRWRASLQVAAMAAIPIVPWLARNTLLTGNPFAPLANSLFPNPYFHSLMEHTLTDFWANHPDFTRLSALWELSVGDKLQGTFGPMLLLAPLGLLALREKAGRFAWLVALLVGLPWIANVNSRFIMGSIPFIALAIAMTLDWIWTPLLYVCLAVNAVACQPDVAARYQNPGVWKLHWPPPWRAALRIESEDEYLTRTAYGYKIATGLLPQNTKPDDITFTLVGVPNCYKDRTLIDTWESALAERLVDTLETAPWIYDLRAEWPEGPFRALRFRLNEGSAHEWSMNNIRVYSGANLVHSNPDWILTAWPNPWESPIAFDENLASRWRTWRARPAGSFLQVDFGRPERLNAADLYTREPAYSTLRIEIYGQAPDGNWKLLSANQPQVVRDVDARREATHFLKTSGVSYIMAPIAGPPGLWQLGKVLVEKQKEFGLEDIAQYGAVHLLRILQ